MTLDSRTEFPNESSEPLPPQRKFKTAKELAAEARARLIASFRPQLTPPKAAPANGVDRKPTAETRHEPAEQPPAPPVPMSELIAVGSVSTARQQVLARRFALEMLANGWDAAEAYRTIARLHGSKARSTRRRLPYIRPASRVVLRWLKRALPYLQQIMAEEREKAGNTYLALQSYLALQMTTSPATFLKHDEQGKVRFDLDQPHILPAQRGMIVSMKIRDGEITDVRTQDGMRAIDLILRLREIEHARGDGADRSSVAKEITRRFQAARLRAVEIQGRKPLVARDGGKA
jgi:hypothetical protein